MSEIGVIWHKQEKLEEIRLNTYQLLTELMFDSSSKRNSLEGKHYYKNVDSQNSSKDPHFGEKKETPP